MPFQTGHKKYGGRKPNENSALKFRNRIFEVDFDVKGFAKKYPETFFKVAAGLCPKILEISGPDGGDFVVQLVNYADNNSSV
jgi:hypothetical protein